MSRIICTGAGGFICNHLIKYLKTKNPNDYILGIDIKYPEWEKTVADEFILQDLRQSCPELFKDIDEVFHLAANMGGISYIENNKADIVWDNTMINMRMLKQCQKAQVKKFLFTSSACVYPGYLQNNAEVVPLKEEDAYPADAEDGYGWEKLMMERACRHFMEDYGLQTYVARFHNIYGSLGTYEGGREKSPAALCRKVALADDTLEIWGDGSQTRSYCHINDCVEGLWRLMQSDYHQPLNIGSDRLVSVNQLADIIMEVAGKKLVKVYDLDKPQGVKGRNADVSKVWEVLGWSPIVSLELGLKETYQWISAQISP